MLKILDICKNIPTSWRDATDLVKFQQVDILTFIIGLKVSEQKTNCQCMKSRQLYEFVVKELQESYSLQIRDGQSNFDFMDKETSKHFIRPRSTTLVRKQRNSSLCYYMELYRVSQKKCPIILKLSCLKYEHLIMGFMICLGRVILPAFLGSPFQLDLCMPAD